MRLVPCCDVGVTGELQPEEFQPTKKKLIVGTIFVDDSPEQKKWLDLQLNYLKLTTEDFDHVVYLPKISDTFSESTNILISKHKDHTSNLRQLLEFFRKNQDYYEYFLFVDSDAFPVQKDWLNILLHKMEDREIATVLRPENLEQRLHASILLAKKSALESLEFPVVKPPIADILGNDENDVQIHPYQGQRHLAFPLLRSNKKEVHPLLCGIYYNLFYHHGCGSGREFNMRAKDYWDHIVTNTDVNKFTDELMKNPTEFIDNLVWK